MCLDCYNGWLGREEICWRKFFLYGDFVCKLICLLLGYRVYLKEISILVKVL